MNKLSNPKYLAAWEIKERVSNGQLCTEALAEVAAERSLDENSLDNFYKRARKFGI